MVDPIADMLTRIRNAIAVNKLTVELPYSKTKAAVAKVLVERGFLADSTVEDDKLKKLVVTLSDSDASSPITEIHRISKPGRRVYVGATDIPIILRGRGIVVVSTSSGIMSGHDARQKGVGGELMCKVW